MNESRGTDTTRVTHKGQTTIPKMLREKYGIEPGDEVVWIDDEAGIRLARAGRTEGRGMLLGDDVAREMHEEAADVFVEELEKARETEWAVQ